MLSQFSFSPDLNKTLTLTLTPTMKGSMNTIQKGTEFDTSPVLWPNACTEPGDITTYTLT